MTPALLLTEDLSIGYHLSKGSSRIVARDLFLSLYPGEIASIIGPNGVGKSTLIRTLAGLQAPLDGKVYIVDREIGEYSMRELARCISVVLTEQIHVGMLTSASIVTLGRYAFTDWTGKLTREDREVVQWALQSVGAESLAERYFEQLSDGERQKIMIARALAQEPRIILLDEPTAFLDVTRRIEIMDLLRRLTREAQRAILLSTHDLELALRVSDRIFLLSTGGKLRSGAPEDLVLSGALEEAFQSEGLMFDRAQGSFVITQHPRGSVTLIGEGLAYLWTCRALERAGYSVSKQPKAGAVRIEVHADETTPAWRFEIKGQTRICDTIYDLLYNLRRIESDENEKKSTVSAGLKGGGA